MKYFVSNKYDWDVFTNSSQILVPFWNIFISNSRADIEHNNCGIGSDTFFLFLEIKFELLKV